jgi:hypothetical protein
LGVSFWCAEVYWWFFWSVLVSLAVNPCTSYDCFVEQNLIIKIEKKVVASIFSFRRYGEREVSMLGRR